MNRKLLTMEVDYNSLARDGCDRKCVERFVERCAAVGVRQMIWSVGFAGTAEYPSKILPRYTGAERDQSSMRAAETMSQYDPLAAAVELTRKCGIKLLAYFRMFDDYWPGMVDTFVDSLPEGWWSSRCGRFHLKGWPCYWLDEVKKHKLGIIREIAEYGVDGFVMGATRSHSLYVCPYTQPHFFGYNEPVAKEFFRRYGLDIRKFDYCVDLWIKDADSGASFVNGTKYVGAVEFDHVQWNWLKGESVAQFIREVRNELGCDGHIALEASIYACPPMADPKDPMPAKLYLNPIAMASERIINEWVIPGNFRDMDFENLILSNFQRFRDTGASFNVWLNDIFSPTGGEVSKWVTCEEVEKYIERFINSSLVAMTLHEAAFLLRHPDSERIWAILGHYFG